MAGSTPAEAVQNFVEPIQKAVSCVTDGVLNVGGGYHPSETPHVLLLNGGSPVGLAGDSRLSLSVIQHYRIMEHAGARGPWKVSTGAYCYSLEDAEGSEVMAYHWHPNQPGVTFPHLHMRADAQVGPKPLHKYHLPTGRVAIEELLRLAIKELGVEVRPRRREDWEDVLDSAQAVYEEWRTWPTSGH